MSIYIIMKRQILINEESVNNMSYTDFVGFVNQWNVPPGAFVTLSQWALFSKLNKQSKLLEVACTTGFSSRELSLMTGCEAIGIDISLPSIITAQKNQLQYAPRARLSYKQVDANEYKTTQKFSHIVVGAALRFFPNPETIIQRIVAFFQNEGYLLSAEFYTDSRIPSKILRKASRVFGITPTNTDYKNVMKVYQGLELVYEDKNEITEETDEEIHHYTRSTVDRAIKDRNIQDNKVKDLLYKRLYEIKKTANTLRPYQRYNVLVHRFRKSIYPHRYVELF